MARLTRAEWGGLPLAERTRILASEVLQAGPVEMSWFQLGARFQVMQMCMLITESLNGEILGDSITEQILADKANIDAVDAESVARRFLEYATYEGDIVTLGDTKVSTDVITKFFLVWAA